MGCRGRMSCCLTGGSFAPNWERRGGAVTPGTGNISQLSPSAVILDRAIKHGDASGQHEGAGVCHG